MFSWRKKIKVLLFLLLASRISPRWHCSGCVNAVFIRNLWSASIFLAPIFHSRRRFVTNKRPKISERLREVKTVMNKLSSRWFGWRDQPSAAYCAIHTWIRRSSIGAKNKMFVISWAHSFAYKLILLMQLWFLPSHLCVLCWTENRASSILTNHRYYSAITNLFSTIC